MIQAVMLITLGFLAASLIGVLLAPSLWSRASRLARKKLESTLPLTLAEIEATHDQLRAAYAVRLRRLETALARAKQKAASQLVDNSRLHMQIGSLNDQIADLELKLSERRNAATVLEQTITKRFPGLDREITAVKAQLQDRSYEIQELTNKLSRREEELAAAQAAATSYQEELNRLHQVLEKSSADRSGRRMRRASQWDLEDYQAEYDRLNLELSKLRQQISLYQDRDAQQAGVIKSELQKLAEMILSSAQPKDEPRLERLEPVARRMPGHDFRREKPVPWTRTQTPAARPKLIDDTEASLNAAPSQQPDDAAGSPPGVGKVSLSPVLTILQEETVLTSAPRNGHGDLAVTRPKILQEVVAWKSGEAEPEMSAGLPENEAGQDGNVSDPQNRLAKEVLQPPGEPASGDAASSNGQAGQGGSAGTAQIPPGGDDVIPLPESAVISPGNSTQNVLPQGDAPETSLAEFIDLERLNPDAGPEQIKAHHPTLLERLVGVVEEPAEAENERPLPKSLRQ